MTTVSKTTMEAAETALKDLVMSAAETKANASLAASQIVLAQMLSLLIDKGIVTPAKIDARLKHCEAQASSLRSTSPDVSDYVTSTTMTLRHGLGIPGRAKN